jgi:hypothetical protein
VVNINDVVDTTTALADAYGGSNFRSAVSTDGTHIWTGGTSSGSTGGVHYTTRGQLFSTQILNTPANVRCMNIIGGQLYLSAASGAFDSVAAVGTGLPTMAGTFATSLPGLPTTSGPSPYDYCMVGSTTLYIADYRSGANGGGIQKWTFDGTTWTLQYTLVNAGCRGLTCVTNGASTILYATTTASSANTLISVTDTGAASGFTVIATAAANTVFRGVAMAPQPPPLTIVRSGGNVMVSWPSPSSGWQLQTNQDLTKTNWGISGATVTDNGTTKSVVITPAGQQFFRLSY